MIDIDSESMNQGVPRHACRQSWNSVVDSHRFHRLHLLLSPLSTTCHSCSSFCNHTPTLIFHYSRFLKNVQLCFRLPRSRCFGTGKRFRTLFKPLGVGDDVDL